MTIARILSALLLLAFVLATSGGCGGSSSEARQSSEAAGTASETPLPAMLSVERGATEAEVIALLGRANNRSTVELSGADRKQVEIWHYKDTSTGSWDIYLKDGLVIRREPVQGGTGQ